MVLSAFDTRRVEVCLASLASGTLPDGLSPEPGTIVCGASETRGSILRRYGNLIPRTTLKGVPYKDYIRQAQALFRPVDPGSVFAIYPADSRTRFAFPTIVKSRMIADRDAGCVLLPLDRRRHWHDVRQVADSDLPFADKDDRLVWRGGTTGVFRPANSGLPYSSRFHVAGFDGGPEIDIGYSEIIQLDETTSDLPMEVLQQSLRPPLSMAQQLRSKFLLSLEGNDVATGLKWMLLSNSTVLMPDPTCESWACEGDLEPFVHYVPVKHDLSDLAEMHDWCRSHLSDCEEIARNGQSFIRRFLDPETEAEVVRAVTSGYLGKVRLRLPFGPFEWIAQRSIVPVSAAIRRAQGKV